MRVHARNPPPCIRCMQCALPCPPTPPPSSPPLQPEDKCMYRPTHSDRDYSSLCSGMRERWGLQVIS